jgi:hypothetical protein
MASELGFADARDICLAISNSVGEPLKVVDLILWRYLADRPGHRGELIGI